MWSKGLDISGTVLGVLGGLNDGPVSEKVDRLDLRDCNRLEDSVQRCMYGGYRN